MRYPRRPKSIIDFKSVQHARSLTGDNTAFRQWHQTCLNVYSVKDEYGEMMKATERELDTGIKPDGIKHNMGQIFTNLRVFVRDLYATLAEKVEGEGYS